MGIRQAGGHVNIQLGLLGTRGGAEEEFSLTL